MPTKTLRVDGTHGVVSIVDYGTSLDHVTDPSSYLANINFHSARPYLRMISTTSVTSTQATFPSVSPNQTPSGGGCGC